MLGRRRGSVEDDWVSLGESAVGVCCGACGQDRPSWGASSTSVILLVLVTGASTGAGPAAVVVWVGALLEVGVGPGCDGCFLFLRRPNRLRRPLFIWPKASSAVSEK